MTRFTNIRGKGLFLLLFLWFLWFMNFNVRTIFSPIMPLVEDEFMISHARASSLFAIMSAGYGMSLFLTGMWSGWFGHKRSIMASMIVSACISLMIPFVNNFPVFSIFSFVLGFTTGIYLPSIIPLITEYYDERTWGRVIAIHDSAASMSIFSAPFIALCLLQFFPWKYIFVVFGIIFILCVVCFSLVCDEIDIHKYERGLLTGLFRSRSLWVFGIIWVFSAGACLGVYFIVPLYLTKELGFGIEYANKVFGISRLGGVAMVVLTGFIIDRFSLKKIMYALIATSGALTVLISWKDIRFIELFLFLQASISTGFSSVVMVSISRVFGKENRAMATGFIVTLGVVFGLGVIPYLLGLAGDYVSFRFGILILGICVMLSSGLVYLLKEIR